MNKAIQSFNDSEKVNGDKKWVNCITVNTDASVTLNPKRK